TDYSSNSGSKAGRDTQHYAWRYEKDPYGKTWLVLGLLPLPYFSGQILPNINVDGMVRRAQY
ncbi:MAG: hypothetical protein P4M14_06850, partial [Gammaproteobacteria bacterium]|nr:hypothetical protein [Gammaproteobacteria bacterium]